MLSVRRGVDAVVFYKAAFGAKELFKIEDAARWWRNSQYKARSSG